MFGPPKVEQVLEVHSLYSIWMNLEMSTHFGHLYFHCSLIKSFLQILMTVFKLTILLKIKFYQMFMQLYFLILCKIPMDQDLMLY